MASTTFKLEDARKSIFEEGVFCMDDTVAGGHVLEMQQKDFPFSSKYGLEFCKLNVLDDMRIRSILESFFDRSSLGLCLKYNNDPGHIFSFRRGGIEAGLRVLIVQLWGIGSRAIYYSGSHLHSLPAVRAANGLWEIPFAAFKRVTCKEAEVQFRRGGLAILDARLAFEIKEGFAITFAFTTEDELKTWAKMLLPKLPELAGTIAEMESTKIGVNFAFET